MKPTCILKNYLRITYDRQIDKIILKPCCNVLPKLMEPPFVYDPEYFIYNLEQCIHQWEQISIKNLALYYTGSCTASSHSQSNFSLCNEYNYNDHIYCIDISISRACNLNCLMCIEHKAMNIREQDIYIRLLKQIKSFPYTIWVTTTTVGEPFLYKDTIFDILEHSNHYLRILTNGVLLTDADIERLSKYKNRIQITVSCDSFVKETYQTIRRGSDFRQAFHVISLLKEKGLLTQINYVVQEENLDEINKYYYEYIKEFPIEIIIKNTDPEIKKKLTINYNNNFVKLS